MVLTQNKIYCCNCQKELVPNQKICSSSKVIFITDVEECGELYKGIIKFSQECDNCGKMHTFYSIVVT